MVSEKSREYIEHHKNLIDQRERYLGVWEDIRDYILPLTGIFNDELPYDRDIDHSRIIDATGTRALTILGAGMQGGLTSPARPWFRLGLRDTELESYRPIKAWLVETERRMYARFAKSNFYNTIHRVYQEEAGYGQAAMIIDRDSVKNDIRYSVLTCGEYCFAEGENGLVDTLFRVIWMQAKQMLEKWPGGNFPSTFRTDASRNPYEWHRILQIIKPRKSYDPSKVDSRNMPWESTYLYLGGDNEIIDASGYRDKPIACPRWNTTGNDPYGKSPGHEILGHAKMLQQMAGDLFEGLEKVVRPPLKSAGSMKHSISHMAGMVSYAEDVSKAESIKPIFEVKIDFSGLTNSINDTRLQIRETCYNDLFLMMVEPRPNMTATEVAERHEEKLLLLGPVIERQFHELLDPTIDRTFSLMYEDGEIPVPPRELVDRLKKGENGADMSVKYVSLLAQAQQLVTTQSIRAVSSYVAEMSSVTPDILDGFDQDKALEEFVKSTGAPPEIMRTEDDRAAIRKVKAAMMQQAKAAAEAEQAAKTARDMSGATLEGDNALTELKRSVEPV